MSAISFCGASMRSFNTTIGWGNNKSACDVKVVVDPRNGDIFNPPPIGTPTYFIFGPSFSFAGILQSWVSNNSIDGLACYDIKIEDPREILAGTQVVISNYHGSTFGIPNILNVYGYYENAFGYEASQVNDSGMYWSQVWTAIQLMTNTPGGIVIGGITCGGPLNFRGVNYLVDLSLIPAMPSFFRIGGGPSRSLLDIINEVCTEAGYDFFVSLVPGSIVPTIRVYTTSRLTQPPLGTISHLVNNNFGVTLKGNSNGVELRNEPTTSFLIGGQSQEIFQTTAIYPFWGYDSQGNAVPNRIDTIPGIGLTNAAFVDATEMASAGVFNDGSTTYYLSEFELQAALRNDQDAWAAYVVMETLMTATMPTHPAYHKAFKIGPNGMDAPWVFTVGVPQFIQNDANANWPVLSHFINQARNFAWDETQFSKQSILFDFVKRIAENWYGRKFWVGLPFISYAQDASNLTIHFSAEISDGGWYPNGDLTPTGLYSQNQIKFMTDDGRVEGYSVYNNVGVNLETLPADQIAWQVNGLYLKASYDRSIYIWPTTNIFLAGEPVALATICAPVSFQTVSDVNNFDLMVKVIFPKGEPVVNPGDNARAIAANIAFQRMRAWGAAGIEFGAKRSAPLLLAVPVKSTVDTYGPWYLAGVPGKVDVVYDTTLTPWEYGNEANMNAAATARVITGASNMQVSEMGSVELAGMPLISLGGTLLAGGPNVTNIDVRFGKEGLTTSYQFRSFTDLHLTRFTRATVESIKRIGRVQNELRKSALLALAQQNLVALVDNGARQAAIRRQPRWVVANQSPHPLIVAGVRNAATSGPQDFYCSASTMELEDALGGIGSVNGNKTVFQNTAAVGMSAIFRPVMITQQGLTGAGVFIPSLAKPNGVTIPLTSTGLNPYSEDTSDIEYLVTGNDPTNPKYINEQGLDWNNVRGIALSMPMLFSGWGIDINGNTTSGNPTEYKVGPLDPLWDMNRGTWSVHDIIFGVTNQAIGPGSTGSVSIMGSTSATLTVSNLFTVGTVATNTIVCAGYLAYQNIWAIIAADCPLV